MNQRREQVKGYVVDILARAGSTMLYHVLPEADVLSTDSYLEGIASESPEVQGFAVILNHDVANPFADSIEYNLKLARSHSARWASEEIIRENSSMFLNPFRSQWGKDIYISLIYSSITKDNVRCLDDAEARKFIIRVLKAHTVNNNYDLRLQDYVLPDRYIPRTNQLSSLELANIPLEYPEFREFLEEATLREIWSLTEVSWDRKSHTSETSVGVAKSLIEKARILEYDDFVWGMLSEIQTRFIGSARYMADLLFGEIKSGSHGVTTEAVIREYFKHRDVVDNKELLQVVILVSGKDVLTWVTPRTGNDYVMKELWEATGSVEKVVELLREVSLSDSPKPVKAWKAFCDNWDAMKNVDVNMALDLLS